MTTIGDDDRGIAGGSEGDPATERALGRRPEREEISGEGREPALAYRDGQRS